MTQSATSLKGLPQVPLQSPLSAKYKDTFAYPTIKDRCPVILCKVIDHLHRQRNNIAREHGAEAGEGLYKVVEELSKLRYEMQTDKPITDILDNTGNAAVWNEYIENVKISEERPSWFTSAWLWVECYMYRRMLQSSNMSGSQQLRVFDFFRHQKEEGFHGSVGSMKQLAIWLLPQLLEMKKVVDPNVNNASKLWQILVQISLWGNKCDLSISAGSKAVATGDPVTGLESLKEFILSNHSSLCWEKLQLCKKDNSSISIVMDNCGFELFTDLCLADFLITSKVIKTVKLRIKDQPWFVSDTTPADLTWSLNQLLLGDENLSQLATRWQDFIGKGIWSVHSDSFWTYPHSCHEMAKAEPQLYQELSEDELVIFKGDLNYRKLVGDLNWETTVSFGKALKDFRPTNIFAIRTAKADVMVGLEQDQAEMTAKKDPNWMVTGQWGVLQFANINS